ncbi:MAG TPA: ester cyclase [Kofleriaceae bacterium]|nr:ester cyclase [Kofleriaceae bacterium]
MVADHVEVAQRYIIELLEERSLDVLSALVVDDYVLREPLALLEGRDALSERLCDTAFSDIIIVIEDLIAADDRVVVRSTWQGVHRGTFFGVEATGQRVTLDVVQVLTFVGSRVSEDCTYYDAYALFEQIGALPPVDKLAKPVRLAPVLRLVP